MPDEAHARTTKARAAQQEHRGADTRADERRIDRKADDVIDR